MPAYQSKFDIVETYADGSAKFRAEWIVPNAYIVDQKEIEGCTVYLDDGRGITGEQRGKIFAMCADVAMWIYGSDANSVKEETRQFLIASFIEAMQEAENPVEPFSLALKSPRRASIDTAREFIDFIVAFCLRHRVPTKRPLRETCDDVARCMYRFISTRTCVISQQHEGVQFHHVDRVGAGRNRRKINHTGMRGLTLLPEYHDEAHTMGDIEFCKKYHLEPIKLTPYLVKQLRLAGIEDAE